MKAVLRFAGPAALALALSACSLGSLLGGGGKAPPTLLTLTPEAPPPGEIRRTAAAGETVTVSVPVVPKEIRTLRVPVQMTPTDVAYVKDVQWVDTPGKLFQNLLAETITRTTGRVVLDPKQAGLDPGLVVSGQLQKFGYDEALQSVVVRYDAALATAGGTRVETRRFEAQVPSTTDRNSIGPAFNRAANQVAIEVAGWVGG